MKTTIAGFAAVLSLSATLVSPAAETNVRKVEELTVHEWGTFTVLQNEDGDALPGVNINEESLPDFVYRLAYGLTPDSIELAPLLGEGTHSRYGSKGISRGFPAAFMRMETPILYFYPPHDAVEPLTIDVRVDFKRGWISEWFPHGEVVAPGFKPKDRKVPHTIPKDCIGSILWSDVTVGSTMPFRKTDSEVWLAPREVRSAPVSVPARKEDKRTRNAERYLFYRGVADLRAPLRVQRSEDGKTLSILANERELAEGKDFPIDALWLADVRKDGKIAFRQLASFTADEDGRKVLARTAARFADSEYRHLADSELRPSMLKAIIKDGLFDDEADALLNTWEASYFESSGLRLFFLLPPEWTDAALPLTISRSGARVERVMIGRIEIITPEQRSLVRKIAKQEIVSTQAMLQHSIQSRANKLSKEEKRTFWNDLMTSRHFVDDYQIEVPADYRAYLDIGRFRDAIVLEESRHAKRTTPSLKKFVKNFRLEYFLQRQGGK